MEAEKAPPANTTLTAIKMAKILTGDNGNQSSKIPMVMTLTVPPAAIQDHTDNPGTSQENEADRKKQHTTPATSERNKQGK